ncbi:hypothetical protein B0H13DRAFT_1862133 [Mycena leptocephala]|nr:hypothetical protein B0H13DRAFT_1862133 [Mycena leptocephala]
MDSSSVVPAKQSAAPDSDDDPSDKNYKPPRNHPVVSEEDDVPEEALPRWQPKGKEKAKKPEKFAAKKDQATTKKPPAKKLKRQAADSADEYGDDEDAPVATTGRNPKKKRWVIMNYQSPPTVYKNRRESQSGAGSVNGAQYEDETIELVVDSNFHSHLRSCEGIPEDASFEDFEAAEAAEKAGTQPVPVASVSNVAAQRQSMSKFVQEGRDNPAVVVTRRGFRKYLIEGIAYDDLPFAFSEKKGMRSLLTYLLPRGWKIHGRKTVKSDITRLSTLLRERVFRYAGAVLMSCVARAFVQIWNGCHLDSGTGYINMWANATGFARLRTLPMSVQLHTSTNELFVKDRNQACGEFRSTQWTHTIMSSPASNPRIPAKRLSDVLFLIVPSSPPSRTKGARLTNRGWVFVS